jgi:hypothetical protein
MAPHKALPRPCLPKLSGEHFSIGGEASYESSVSTAIKTTNRALRSGTTLWLAHAP